MHIVYNLLVKDFEIPWEFLKEKNLLLTRVDQE